jgi:hypothetical protein
MGRWEVQKEYKRYEGRWMRYGFLYLKKRWVEDTEPSYIGWSTMYVNDTWAVFDTKNEAYECINKLRRDVAHMETPPEEYPRG